MKKLDKKNIRYNVLSMFIYLAGLMIIIKLFNIQIINGQKYLQESNSRLTRETTIKASRGSILDCNGVTLAGTKVEYSLEIYKSKISEEELNNTLLRVITILARNSDGYINSFPINIDTFEYAFLNNEEIEKWLQDNNLEANLNAQDALNYYINKYNLQNFSLEDAAKIVSLRYGLEKSGYTSMRPYVISNKICERSMLEILEQNSNFPGIAIQGNPIREYKYGNLASHVLGYVGKISEEEYKKLEGYALNDYIGKTGVENIFENYLKGNDGLKQTDMAIDGSITGEYITKEAESGANIILSIDTNIQQVAEDSLKEIIEKINKGEFGKVYNAKTGAVVALNTRTGEVIAMCSYPSYEPQLFIDGISQEKWNEYTNKETSALLNRSIQNIYSPGSVYKMVTAIAGLESGVINTSERINDTGIYYYGDSSWRCWIYSDYGRGHGSLNVSDAIKHSCNYFFYETAKRMGIDTLEKYARYFGLGSKTGIELPGEEAGILACKKTSEQFNKTWYGGDTLSAAIGQGDNSFTPLQIAKYIAMLTNGGKDIDVSIIKRVERPDGVIINKTEIDNYINETLGIKDEAKEDLNIKKETLEAVLEGMKSVTTETGGTAYSVFKNFNIEVGGKTGSAEAGKNVNAWFVGFAPYNNPEIAAVVFVENGGHGYYTANVAKAIFESYFGETDIKEEDKTAIPYTEQTN